MKQRINDYRELIAYQKSYQLVLEIYRITRDFPKEELYGITSQIRRAAVSVPSNISEGFMRGSKEYLQFLKIALGSAAELETQLSLSKDLGFCNDANFSSTRELASEVMKLLTTYIQRIGNSNSRQRTVGSGQGTVASEQQTTKRE